MRNLIAAVYRSDRSIVASIEVPLREFPAHRMIPCSDPARTWHGINAVDLLLGDAVEMSLATQENLISDNGG